MKTLLTFVLCLSFGLGIYIRDYSKRIGRPSLQLKIEELRNDLFTEHSLRRLA